MYIVSVLVEHPTSRLDRTFDYLSNQEIKAGIRVKIAFGNQRLIGYVEEVKYTNLSKQQLEEDAGFSYRFILEVIDDTCLLNDELSQLANYLSDITLAPKIACLQAMLPNQLKPTSSLSVKKKYERYAYLINNEVKIKANSKNQKKVIEMLNLKNPSSIKELNVPSSTITRLIELKIIEVKAHEFYREVEYTKIVSKQHQLTTDQTIVLQGILDCINQFKIHLIHGVTGSGKTEVYLNATNEVLNQGKNVIMLVPEIALTPKMVSLFKEKFSQSVAVLHSRLSAGERYDEYRKIAENKVRVVVGARSAVFAPLRNIGLIIMDEEHEASYKQESTPRYHTKEIAILRAKYHQCPLVLGSATPSLESYARAKKGVYQLHELPIRINNQALPKYTIIDMATEKRQGNYSLFSNRMIEGMKACLKRNEQIVLLLNRRGYAQYVTCKACGYTPRCSHCDVTLTHHKSEINLKCHYCGHIDIYPSICPQCNSNFIRDIGYGTQKVEEELNKILPQAKIIRFDVDTTSKKNAHQTLLSAFEKHEADILLGTQMIAKGLDIENVTFVGVVDADSSLNIPDFRANERTFQLITQVAGRSGRGGKLGEVVIQTYNPFHYAIVYGAAQDYHSFYQQEIKYRQLANYPPFCYLISILVFGKNEEKVTKKAEEVYYMINNNLKRAQALGPSKSMIYKIKDDYRYRILIKYRDKSGIFELLKHVYIKYRMDSERVMIDVNPYSQL